MKCSLRLCCALTALWCSSTVACYAMFDLQLNFQGGLTPDQQAIFSDAEQFWESKIIGYQPGVTLTGLTINVAGTSLDGPGGQLGSGAVLGSTAQAGYRLATLGSMNFDSADIDNYIGLGLFDDIVKHEMAHALGFGVLWSQNGLIEVVPDLEGPVPDRYIGPYAVAAYAREWVPGATFVPVEDEGGGGTAGLHWNEAANGAAFTGIVLLSDPSKDFAYELMTGWLNYRRYDPIISDTTIQSFRDLGYMTIPSPVQVPEPASIATVAGGLLVLAMYFRRAA